MNDATRSLLGRYAGEMAAAGNPGGLTLMAEAVLAVWAHADPDEALGQLRFLLAVYDATQKAPSSRTRPGKRAEHDPVTAPPSGGHRPLMPV